MCRAVTVKMPLIHVHEAPFGIAGLVKKRHRIEIWNSKRGGHFSKIHRLRQLFPNKVTIEGKAILPTARQPA